MSDISPDGETESTNNGHEQQETGSTEQKRGDGCNFFFL